MPNYQEGKIYKITGGGLTYIGSTTLKTLAKRLAGHKADIKRGKKVSSRLVLCHDDCDIVLLENFPCNNKDELHARERYWIDQYDCVNKVKMPYRTNEDKLEYDRKHYYGNLVQKREYYEKNKEKMKAYRDGKKEQTKEYMKKWREEHKDQIREYNKNVYENRKLEKNI